MSDKDIFGLEISPDEPIGAPITEEPLEMEETSSEESPVEDEGQPRDELGRFTAQTASEEEPAAEEPEPETPADSLEEDVSPQGETEPDSETDPFQAWLETMPEGYQFANKFANPVELEKGYNNSIEMWRRANEARKIEAQEKLALQEQYAALYRQMEQAVPVLQQAAEREQAHQAFAEKYRQQYGEYPEGYTPPAPRPQPGPVDVEAMVDQRLAAERAAWQAQMAQQNERNATEDSVRFLYENHPELDPSSDAHSYQIYDTLNELNEAWDRYGIEIDSTDRGSLEIVYQASRDAALLEVLKLKPEYFESEMGMELARRDAAVISGRVPAITEPQTSRVPASQVKASGARKPFTESAAVGANAPATEDENDPWVRVKNADVTGGAKPGSRPSPFFE